MTIALGLLAAVFTVETVTTDGKTVVETMEFAEKDGVTRFVLPRAKVPKNVKSVSVTPDFAVAKTGDEGFWVFPNNAYGTFHGKSVPPLGYEVWR